MVTANMTHDTLCFIEKNERPKSLSSAIADEVEKNSSNYVSHETHTFTIQGNVWTASELQLNKARSVSLKAHSMDRAKIAEGVLRFGQFPNLKDGRGRIVFLFIQLHQLLVVPKKWVECWGYRASVGVRCLQVGDMKIPLGVGLSHEEPEEWYDAIDSQKEIKNYGGPINCQAIAIYKAPKRHKLMHPCNIVRGGSSIKRFLELQIRQESASLCSCDSDVCIKHVTVTLVENLQFKVLQQGSYGVVKESRRLVLKDSDIHIKLPLLQFVKTADGYVSVLDKSVFNCDLPNLGPTFLSNGCTRTYLIKLDHELECSLAEKPCSSSLSTQLDIEVAMETELSEKTALSKVGKSQDVVIIDQFPKDTMIVQNVSEHVLEEVSKIDNCLGHQTCILCQRDNVIMITTIYSSSPANSSKLSISQNTQKIDDNEADEKPDDFALVASNGFWKLKSTCGFSFDREVSFPLSKSFHVFDEDKFANNYESSSGNYSIRALHDQPLLASPKLYFGRILKFSIDAPHTHSSFQNLVVQIAKQSIHLTPQGRTAEQELFTFKLSLDKIATTVTRTPKGLNYVFQNPVDYFIINICGQPSLHSKTSHEGYQLKFSLEAKEDGSSTIHQLSSQVDLYLSEVESFYIEKKN